VHRQLSDWAETENAATGMFSPCFVETPSFLGAFGRFDRALGVRYKGT